MIDQAEPIKLDDDRRRRTERTGSPVLERAAPDL